MIRLKLTYIALLACLGLSAQIDPNLILGLTTATTSEMNSIVGSYEGSLLYNTDDKNLYVYNGSAWVKSSNDNWLLTGNAATAGTSFLGTTNDVAMDLRSNNISTLQFGRRQTLGLVQAYPDYTDANQYLTYLKGNNGVSALQFQADAAGFYKPMFYTNSDGNFRLKGSAAGTDLFEIGSTGTSNNGEVEFIIGDDGAEPFVFKRYDYRDQLLKELMRIQGSSDAQNAKPRVGIATNAVANSTLQINGSLSTSTITPTSNITLDESHYTVIINSNINVTLPAANSASGRVYVIKNTTSTAKTISAYIDNAGNTASQISAQNTLWLQSDGSSWNSISPSASQTALVVSADANNSIQVGTDGGAYLKINYGGRWTNTNTSTNLNSNNTSAPIFGSQDYKDDGNNLYEASSSTSLTVKEDGRYDIRANLSLEGINSGGNAEQRTSVNARIYVNNTAVGAIAATGYIRFSNGHEETSLHMNEILELSANDVITIRTFEEGNSGVVRFSGSGESSFMINKLR
jgi:hypothetical protein